MPPVLKQYPLRGPLTEDRNSLVKFLEEGCQIESPKMTQLDNKEKYQCPYCGNMISMKEFLDHMKNQHYSKPKIPICTFHECCGTFTDLPSLELHRAFEHSNTMLWCKCYPAGRWCTPGRSFLMQHLKVQHAGQKCVYQPYYEHYIAVVLEDLKAYVRKKEQIKKLLISGAANFNQRKAPSDPTSIEFPRDKRRKYFPEC